MSRKAEREGQREPERERERKKERETERERRRVPERPLINYRAGLRASLNSGAKGPVFHLNHPGGDRVLLLQEAKPHEALQQTASQVSQENVLQRGKYYCLLVFFVNIMWMESLSVQR